MAQDNTNLELLIGTKGPDRTDECTCCSCGYTWKTGQEGGHSCSATLNQKISDATSLAIRYGQIQETHHQAWVIDQMLRALLGQTYSHVIADNSDEDNPWDVGIAP